MYWDAVLEEVLNKDQAAPTFTLTNLRENKFKAGLIAEKKLRPRPLNRKHFLGEKYPGVYLTEREAQTMHYLLRGQTTAQVAEILQLSRRTVEFYLKNMKTKLECRLKSELICKILNTDFYQRYETSVDYI